MATFLSAYLHELQRILATLQAIRHELREILELLKEIEAHQNAPRVRFSIGTAEPK